MLKPIPAFKDYSISLDGFIWSYFRSKPLKPSKNKGGYLFVVLCKKKKHYPRTIHRLILETYIGKRKKSQVCRHLNGIKIDNRLCNLVWGTQRENGQDALKHGKLKNLFNKGEKHSFAKLKEEEIRKIIYLWKTESFTQKELAEIYQVSRPHISFIVNKKTWKHLWRK